MFKLQLTLFQFPQMTGLQSVFDSKSICHIDLFHLDSYFLCHSSFDLVNSFLAVFAARKVAQMIECYHLR